MMLDIVVSVYKIDWMGMKRMQTSIDYTSDHSFVEIIVYFDARSSSNVW